MRASLALAVALALVAALIAPPAQAQPLPGYQHPPKSVADMLDARLTPRASVSPNRQHLLLQEQPAFPSITEVSAPERRLAGLRLDPRQSAPSRRTYSDRLNFLDLRDPRTTRPVRGLPTNARIAETLWAPTGARIAFTVTDERGVSLWLADAADGHARRLGDLRLSSATGPACTWWPDGQSLLCKTIPGDRGAEPVASEVPSGPVIHEATGKKAPSRTYPDTLKGPHDERLFEHHTISQLVRVTLDGKSTPLGAPALIDDFTPSPDGKYILVQAIHRPFSYREMADRFPRTISIWDPSGKPIKQVADLPLHDAIPVDFAAVQTGPREFEWRADADAELCWVEARDGGDPKRKAAVRDELLCLAAPFTGKPRVLLQLALRYGGVRWGTGTLALVNEWWWSDRKTRTWLIAPDDKKPTSEVLWDRSSEDRYSDPGDPLLRRTARGTHVLHTGANGRTLMLFGDGASPDGDRPFIDTLNLTNKNRRADRQWRSEAPYYEVPFDILDDAGTTVLARRESVSDPPQYLRRKLGTPTPTVLTNFPHPSPQLAKVEKRLIKYKRNDGVALTGMLYLPPGFQLGKDKPLSLLMWAYPTEFKSSDSAGQVTDSPHRFVRVAWWSPLWALALGYAVLDDPTMPIVGEGSIEPNDTYVTQLVASAQAAVDEVVRLGVTDRDHIAIGGHSYGAFMTANLLAHSNLFRTGIARSGAYNRTLTPFGFQAEERTLWQAPKTYVEMSPFNYADKIDEPILMVHGQADNNPGTFTLQSERLFEAIKGLGGTARLVLLPAESHGYLARESVHHTMWEQVEWLEKHLKKATKRPAK
jgi:dipeptidyl aminopeptidase/acylaminoacyl peptidase